MNLLFFQFPFEPAWGGAEEHSLLLAKILVTKGYKVRLFSNNSCLCAAFRKSGIPASRVCLGWEPTTRWSIVFFPFTALWAVLFFLYIFINYRPQGIFCLSLTDKLIATWLAAIFGVKKIFWNEHTRIGRWLSSNPLLPLYRTASRWATIIAPSYFLRNQLVAVGIKFERIRVVYPAPSWSPLRRVSNKKFSHIIFGYLGRLTREKGVDDLLTAASKSQIRTQIIVAGAGPEEEYLKLLTEKLGLRGVVSFIGHISDKRTFFQKVSILIVPSILPESFGLVAVEAMTSGVPVIASRSGGLAEIIEHKKTGLLYEPGNIGELCGSIELLGGDRDLYSFLSEQAYQSVLKRFSPERMGSAFLRLLDLPTSSRNDS